MCQAYAARYRFLRDSDKKGNKTSFQENCVRVDTWKDEVSIDEAGGRCEWVSPGEFPLSVLREVSVTLAREWSDEVVCDRESVSQI